MEASTTDKAKIKEMIITRKLPDEMKSWFNEVKAKRGLTTPASPKSR